MRFSTGTVRSSTWELQHEGVLCCTDMRYGPWFTTMSTTLDESGSGVTAPDQTEHWNGKRKDWHEESVYNNLHMQIICVSVAVHYNRKSVHISALYLMYNQARYMEADDTPAFLVLHTPSNLSALGVDIL